MTTVEPLLALVLQTLPSAASELLRRCAIPRTFDRDVVSSILMPEFDAASFNTLQEAGLVESARGADGDFRLHRLVRATMMERWHADEEELVGIRAKLADYWFEARPLEALYHLIAVDQKRAAELLRTAFEQAAERYDLARCESLLAVFDDEHALGPELEAVRDEHRLRVERMAPWVDDWHRTRRFLEREGARERFEQLLAPGGPSVLRMHATGGMGKTMHLRWLTSHVCARQNIPCARIDFDAVVPTVALEEPGLVLLNFADQLNRQLAMAPLTEVLVSDDAYVELPRLLRGGSPARGLSQETARRRDADFTEAVRDRLAAGLGTLPASEPIVLILDTLEVAVLRTGTPLTMLVDQLAALVEQCPAIRIVFAGRFDLAERVPEHRELFASAIDLSLQPFSDSERRRYLERRLRPAASDELIAAIVRRSDGTPLKLALIAEIVEGAEGKLAVSDLDPYDRVDLMYLLERVLLRIDDMDVRWLVRYGATVRLLDRRLLVRVMWPVLVQEMADSPRDAIDGGIPSKAAGAWQRKPPPETVERLWRGLRHYADATSWVTVQGDAPRETMWLSADVVEPMRRLVGDHAPAVYEQLEVLAAQDFQQRAHEEPHAWARWTKEELYHRLHLDAGAAAPVVLRRLGDAPHVAARRELLQDLLSFEYNFAATLLGEHDDFADSRDTRPHHPAALLAELLRQAALLDLPDVRRGDEQAWDHCRAQLVRLERLAAKTGCSPPEFLLAALRAALDLNDPTRREGRRARAAENHGEALKVAVARLEDPGERLQALLILADVYAELQPAEAAAALRDAEEVAWTSTPDGAPKALAIGERLIEHLFRVGAIDEALGEIGRLRSDARAGAGDRWRLELQELRLRMYAAEPVWACARAEAVARGGMRGTPQRVAPLLTGMRAALEARDPQRALRLDWEIERLTSSQSKGIAQRVAVIDQAGLRAQAFAQRGQVTEALDAIERAERIAGLTAGGAMRRLLSVRLGIELRLMGDPRRAEITLERGAAAASGAEDYAALVLRLQRVEWLAMTRDRQAAEQELRAIVARLERDGAPRGHHVRAALEGLALGADPVKHARRLTAHLELVRPAAARLMMLRELARAAPLPAGRVATRFHALLVEAPDATEHRREQDGVVTELLRVEVQRVAGQAGRGALTRRLQDIEPDTPRACADWIEAAARAGLPGGMADRGRRLVEDLAEHEPQLAALVAVALAAAACAKLSGDDLDTAQRAIVLGQRFLDRELLATGPGRTLTRIQQQLDERGDELAVAFPRLALAVGGIALEGDLPFHITHVVNVDRVEIEHLTSRFYEGSRDGVPFDLVRAISKDWSRFVDAMGASLRKRVPDDAGAVRLVVQDLLGHALPWELIDAPWASALVRSSPTQPKRSRPEARAEPDGGIAIVAPSTSLESITMRARENWADSTGAIYRRCGLHPKLIDASELSWRATPSFAVLHVMAPFVEIAGAPAIDLSGAHTERALHSYTQARELPLHATTFARMVDGRVRLIVLDPPPVSSMLELTHQLLLRNAFAGAVHDAGEADAIICIGLGGYPSDEGSLVLAQGLRTGQPLGVIAETLRRVPDARTPHGGARFRGASPTGFTYAATTALFADDPYISIEGLRPRLGT